MKLFITASILSALIANFSYAANSSALENFSVNEGIASIHAYDCGIEGSGCNYHSDCCGALMRNQRYDENGRIIGAECQ